MGSLEAPGVRLRQLRLSNGLTQQQVAAKAGISYFTLSKIEAGITKLPSAKVLLKLSTVLHFDIDEFLGKRPGSITAKPSIKFIYSDIGGVLVHTESAFFHHLSVVYNRSPNKIQAVYYTYVPYACQGKLRLHDLQLLMLLKLSLRLNARSRPRLFTHWVDYMTPIPESQLFITQLAKHYPLGLLTDTIKGFVERMEKKKLLPQLPYKALIKSCDVGFIKPSPQIFEIATRAAGVEPSEILFIDDKRLNVRGARAYGWQAEWFNELNPKASIARIKRKYF